MVFFLGKKSSEFTNTNQTSRIYSHIDRFVAQSCQRRKKNNMGNMISYKQEKQLKEGLGVQ
jgi:hypothetical protein